MIVSSIIPVNKKSLIMGSTDAGGTVLNSDPVLQSFMKQVGYALNLKGHFVIPTEGEPQFLYGPMDLEGHFCRDGRYYLIDTARLFPCAYSTKNPK